MNKLDENNENNKKEYNDAEDEGEKEMAKKRIHNPKTGKYYSIRQKSSKYGKKGQIKGRWRQPSSGRKKRTSSDKMLIVFSFAIFGGILGAFFVGVIGVIFGFILGGAVGAIVASD